MNSLCDKIIEELMEVVVGEITPVGNSDLWKIYFKSYLQKIKGDKEMFLIGLAPKKQTRKANWRIHINKITSLFDECEVLIFNHTTRKLLTPKKGRQTIPQKVFGKKFFAGPFIRFFGLYEGFNVVIDIAM